MSDLATSYITYLAAYRVVILLVGAFAVYLGYRLYVRGVWPETGGGTEIDAKVAGHHFTVKNAAPGTVVGLFGVAVITTMVVGAPPQGTFEQMVGVTSKDGCDADVQAAPLSHPASASTRWTLRGDDDNAVAPVLGQTIAALNAQGVEAEAAGELDAAAEHYQHALDLIAAPTNNLAWLRFKGGDAERALPLATLAVQLSPDSASFLHTLAEIHLRLGHVDEAKTRIREAAVLDPDSYAAMLSRFEESR
ncbi:MAG: tetratricopeptide repeat protein [Thermoanaerobaculia bacterium]